MNVSSNVSSCGAVFAASGEVAAFLFDFDDLLAFGQAPTELIKLSEDSAVGIHTANGAGAGVITRARPEAFAQDTTLADWVVPGLAPLTYLKCEPIRCQGRCAAVTPEQTRNR